MSIFSKKYLFQKNNDAFKFKEFLNTPNTQNSGIVLEKPLRETKTEIQTKNKEINYL